MDDPADGERQLARRRDWTHLMYESRVSPDLAATLDGRLAGFVSVESVITDTPQHVAVFDKLPLSTIGGVGQDGADSVLETGDIVPSALGADTLAELRDYTTRCLATLGVSWRVTHTEIMLTPQGPELIEVNGRTAGFLARPLAMIGGPNLVRLALELAAGNRPDLGTEPTEGHAAVLLLPFSRRSGTVRSMVTPDDLRSLPGVVSVDEIAAARRPRADTAYRMVNLLLHASTRTQLDADVAASAAAVRHLFGSDT